ncbi:MAG: hypothetical protein WDM92_02830 [Caulobacteraceae bacterium]
MATFVLVHGAWSGGWGYTKTARLMRAEGPRGLGSDPDGPGRALAPVQPRHHPLDPTSRTSSTSSNTRISPT